MFDAAIKSDLFRLGLSTVPRKDCKGLDYNENEFQIVPSGEAVNEILPVERRDWKDLHGSNSLCEDLIASDGTANSEVPDSITVW